MAQIAAHLKQLVRYVCFFYLALPDLTNGSWSMVRYQRKISRLSIKRRIRRRYP